MMRIACGFVAAWAAASAAVAAGGGWKIVDVEKARNGSARSMLVAITEGVQPRGSFGTCRIEAIALGTERGRGLDPGSPLGAFIPCAALPAHREGRWTAMADLGPGRLARLHLGADGRPRDLEMLPGRTDALEPSAAEADRRQLWRLIDVGKEEALLVDTDDVKRDGPRRVAWMKRSLGDRRVRNIVQIITRVEYDCASRTQTLHAWYARTANDRTDSQGAVPNDARRAVPVTPKTQAATAMAVLCAPSRLPRS